MPLLTPQVGIIAALPDPRNVLEVAKALGKQFKGGADNYQFTNLIDRVFFQLIEVRDRPDLGFWERRKLALDVITKNLKPFVFDTPLTSPTDARVFARLEGLLLGVGTGQLVHVYIDP